MSYGSNNPPWQRNAMSGVGGGAGQQQQQQIPSLQTQMGLPNPNMVGGGGVGGGGGGGYQNNQSIYNTNMSMGNHQQNQNQGNMSMIPPIITGGGGQMFGGQPQQQTVAYPTRGPGGPATGLNPNAFGHHAGVGVGGHGGHGGMQQQGGGGGGQQGVPSTTSNRIGTVTKIQNDYGFIDEEVFFHRNSCKGNFPKLGDRVLVEATYSTNAAFKWNATRVQLMGTGGVGVGGGGGIGPAGNNVGGGNVNSGVGGGIQSHGGGGMGPQRNMQQQPQQQQHHLNHNVSQQQHGGNNNRTGSGYNAVPPPNAYAGGFDRSGGGGGGGQMGGHNRQSRNMNVTSPPPRRSSPLDRHVSRNLRNDSRPAIDNDDDRKKRRGDDRDNHRGEKDRKDRGRETSGEKQRNNYSPERRVSPKRRRTGAVGQLAAVRTVPRYMVQVPKVRLDMVEADVLELRRRYTNLYVPSDFFFTEIRWSDSFPPNATFSIQKPCAFHIMHKSVETVSDDPTAVLDPQDADYLFSAKVMLMGVPPMAEMYRKCFATAEETVSSSKERDSEERSFVHPTRLINFLVGVRGKNEAMALGGPWSPSLDGADPAGDPAVLIRTAIRTCRALTGIDLTPCTQWYRFVELYYRRPESVRKGRTIPARVETVVVYLPDVRSCVPTRLEWDDLNVSYRRKCDQVISQRNQPTAAIGDSKKVAAAASSLVSKSTSSSVAETSSSGAAVGNSGGMDVQAADDAADANYTDGAAADAAEAAPEKEGGLKREPTNYAQLDPKSMKVSDLRDELAARNMSSKGLKPQLVARLTKVLKAEETDANDNEDDDADEEAEQAEEEETIEEGAPEDESAADDGQEVDDKANNDETSALVAAEGTEIDMADIMVIDEYDSTKEKKEVKEVDLPVKPLDERERRELEKRYKLPEHPHLVVHPSRIAKSGRFLCKVMSLSILLDYRPEDTKEHTFEVSLFAELFNEMLMRDFGFNIYKALVELPEPAKEDKETDKDAAKSTTTVEPADATGEPKEKRAKRGNDEENDDVGSEKNESDDRRSKGNKRRARNDDDDNVSVQSESRRKPDKDLVKLVRTVDPDLLLSFVYFDTSHCGYIFEKDIEDLFYTLGLSLSRAQVRKLLFKVVTKDALSYRSLTDRPKEETESEADAGAKPDETASNTDALARGNRAFLPIFRKELKGGNETEAVGESNGESHSAMVAYKGSFIDIEKLLDQMKRSEKARTDTEQLLVDLRKTNADLTSSYTRSKDKIRDLQSDVKSYSRKLTDAEQSLSSVTKKSAEYHSILSSVHDRVSVVFAKASTSSSSATSSSKSDRPTTDNGKKDRSDREEVRSDRETKDAKSESAAKEAKVESATKEVKVDQVKEVKVDQVKEIKLEPAAKEPVKVEPDAELESKTTNEEEKLEPKKETK